MNRIRVAGAAINTTPLDWKANLRALTEAITKARAAGAAILCLPELCITGYGCEDAFGSADMRRRAWNLLNDLLPQSRGMLISCGLPILFRNGLFNCAAVLVDGKLAGLVAKRHLAGEGLHYEPRWFKPWPEGVRAEVTIEGTTVPIGDLHFDIGGVTVGFEICEDAWVASRPGARLASRGVDVILNPSASHFAFGKMAVRERFVLEGSRAFGAAYVYTNLLGNEAGRAIYDGGVLIASGGRLLARGPRFTFDQAQITCADIDLDRQHAQQARTHSVQPDLSPDPNCISIHFDLPATPDSPPLAVPVAAWETGPHLLEEEFTRAVSLGLIDYLRKSRSQGFVVSLSGGADSSGVVTLVRIALALAANQIGDSGLTALLSPCNVRAGTLSEITGQLLTTLYQSAASSSDATRRTARIIADAVGAKHYELDVAPMVESYTKAIERAVGRSLSWKTDDLALQNIQARSRAPGAWLLANIQNKLLLVTSNRSEAAVGYATMDGDTCGGLAPIAGIDKAFLLRWLAWMQATGPAGIGPLSQLSEVLKLKPSPELRPAEFAQTSEGDLMPYVILERIEELAIGNQLAPLEAFQMLKSERPDIPPATLAQWIEKFYRLWCRNQWKRERYAPSFHVDDHNLDPKTWCRFPILSGNFETELKDLLMAVQP